jgi:hypothetical protein
VSASAFLKIKKEKKKKSKWLGTWQQAKNILKGIWSNFLFIEKMRVTSNFIIIHKDHPFEF